MRPSLAAMVVLSWFVVRLLSFSEGVCGMTEVDTWSDNVVEGWLVYRVFL